MTYSEDFGGLVGTVKIGVISTLNLQVSLNLVHYLL